MLLARLSADCFLLAIWGIAYANLVGVLQWLLIAAHDLGWVDL